MLSFIVPAFNEVENIEPTVETVRAIAAESNLTGYEIIIVDDGSTDGTHERIAALKGRLPEVVGIRHGANQGLGSAIRSGLAVARYSKFMILPGDNDIHRDMMRLMLTFRDEADMIVTVPLNKEIRSFGRNGLSMLYQLIHMLFFKVFVNYINGPGIWPTEQARAVGLQARRFSIISELNMKLLRSGCSFAEVPGYLQTGSKGRRTVTWRNLLEVVRSFLSLLYAVHVRDRARFSARPRRVQIDFANYLRARERPELSKETGI